ncbi:MAG: type II toxin-antitoxin system VapC family toxin [Vicinamibacterales bacterium]
MTLYVESSAVLAWLLEQEHGERAAAALASAELVITSDITLTECDRVLVCAVALNELSEADAAGRQTRLNMVAARWTLLGLDDEIAERARRPFAIEPVRTLDALHLASALVAQKALPGLAVLSLDRRVREVAERLGLVLLPSDEDLG